MALDTESIRHFSYWGPANISTKLKKEVFKKRMYIGNSRIIIHSELLRLTSEERRQWYKEEMEKGNPILKNIALVLNYIYWENAQRKAANMARKDKLNQEDPI